MLNCKDVFPKVLLEIGPVKIHFYGVIIVLSLLLAVFLIKQILEKKKVQIKSKIKSNDLFDIAFWCLLGGVIGGRIAYVLFYNLPFFYANPIYIFAIWKGGLSVHGGIIGGTIALITLCKLRKWKFLEIADLIVPFFALGLAFGRIANFVNGELVGRETDFAWGCNFGDGINRWPVQLIDSLKNFVIFGITLYILLKIKPSKGVVSGLFLLLIGALRFSTEFLREPDPQLGFIIRWITMGQILASLTVIAGLLLICYSIRKIKKEELRKKN